MVQYLSVAPLYTFIKVFIWQVLHQLAFVISKKLRTKLIRSLEKKKKKKSNGSNFGEN
jgi:hypothetical protein